MALIRRTACTRDCPDACELLAEVEGQRVLRLRGDPGHPFTRGFLCQRTNRFLERQYDPARLRTPLLRGADGELHPVGWEEALDLAAERLAQIREETGPAAILHYRSGGSLGVLQHVTGLFFRRFGPVSVKGGDICSGAGEAAQELDFGLADSNDPEDLTNSRAIVLWGRNPHVSWVHHLPVLREARSRGARLALVDPVRHRAAGLCDLVLQPRPGGDLDLALGVARVLLEAGLWDEEAAALCHGLEAYRRLVLALPVGERARRAGVGGEELRALAELYGRNRPANIQVGWGMQRRRHGGAIVRALDALGLVTGNVGIPGGGVSFYWQRQGAFRLEDPQAPAEPPRRLPEARLGRAILEAADPPIRAVWVQCGNPVAMLPESDTVASALRSREFTVVVDAFLTDTARCAHLVLPCTTMLEDEDLVGAYGNHWLHEVRPVIPPPEGVRSDLAIVAGLARRLGLGAEFPAEPEMWKRRFLERVAGRGAGLEDLRQGPVRNPLAPPVAFAGRRFPTPDGRPRLLEEEPATYTAAGREDLPLLLMPVSVPEAQCSQWHPVGADRGPLEARVHPDAPGAGADGGLARLVGRRGALTVRVRHDRSLRPEVVVVPKGGWLADGRCANLLVTARETDLGGGACYYEEPVRLEPVAGDPVRPGPAVLPEGG